jgi:hypothetical protein
MSKRICMALLPLLVLLTGCAGKSPAATVPPATATLPLATATQKPESSPTATRLAKEPGCTVTSPKPTAGPTQESLFPSKTSYDFSQGPDGASVTIIEYSDFQ